MPAVPPAEAVAAVLGGAVRAVPGGGCGRRCSPRRRGRSRALHAAPPAAARLARSLNRSLCRRPGGQREAPERGAVLQRGGGAAGAVGSGRRDAAEGEEGEREEEEVGDGAARKRRA